MNENNNQAKAQQLTQQQAAVPAPIQRFNKCIGDIKTQDYLKSVLGSKKDQFVANLVALVSNDIKLQACTPMSLIYAALKATALDLQLDPSIGQAYVIPYKNKKERIVEAQFQVGYKGFIQLGLRTNLFARMNVTEVYEGELKCIDMLTGDIILDRVPDREKLPIIGYAAYFRLNNGKTPEECFQKAEYRTIEEVEIHAKKYSQSYSSEESWVVENSPWTTNPVGMGKKTVLKSLLNHWAPLSIEMREALVCDQAVIDEQGKPKYVDSIQEDITDQRLISDVEDKKQRMREQQGNEEPVNTLFP